MSRLHYLRAIVTGAGQGIGRAIVQRFLEEGARVVANDIDPDRLAECAASIDVAHRDRLATIVGDASDPSDVERMIRRAEHDFGGLEILVNNAGIGGVGNPIDEVSFEEWLRMIDVDLTSVFLCCQAALPLLRTAGGGSIINLSSITGIQGAAGSVPYAAAKAGVIGLTKSLAKEVAADAIRVNAIAPGLIDTEMSRARGQKETGAAVLWPRIGHPDDIAWLAVYLASHESEFLTGQVIEINGGARM